MDRKAFGRFWLEDEGKPTTKTGFLYGFTRQALSNYRFDEDEQCYKDVDIGANIGVGELKSFNFQVVTDGEELTRQQRYRVKTRHEIFYILSDNGYVPDAFGNFVKEGDAFALRFTHDMWSLTGGRYENGDVAGDEVYPEYDIFGVETFTDSDGIFKFDPDWVEEFEDEGED